MIQPDDEAEPLDGTLRIVLPWPPRGLSPNARLHWAPKAKLTKQVRAAAAAITRQAVRQVEPLEWIHGNKALPVTVALFPPHGRLDWDNAVAMQKANLDGVAEGLAVNDKRFRPAFVFGQPVKGGRVVVDVPWNGVEQGQECVEGVGGYMGSAGAPKWFSGLPRAK